MISIDTSHLLLAADILLTIYAIEKAQHAYSIFWALFSATISGILVIMYWNGGIMEIMAGGSVPVQDQAMAFLCLFLAGFQILLFIALVYGTVKRMAEVTDNAEEEEE